MSHSENALSLPYFLKHARVMSNAVCEIVALHAEHANFLAKSSAHSDSSPTGILSLPSEDITDSAGIAPARPHGSRREGLPSGPAEMTNGEQRQRLLDPGSDIPSCV